MEKEAVLEDISSAAPGGVTVLPVKWTYMNLRLIVKPDEEWAKIMDDSVVIVVIAG